MTVRRQDVRIQDVRGLWKRRYLRSPAGTDETTAVYWMQGEHMFSDVRIPEGVIAGAADIASLASCDGFAGTTAVEESVCRWHREMNFRGRETGEDAGRLFFDDGALFEEGVHADYIERWERVGSPGDPVGSSRLTLPDGGAGILVWTVGHFLYAHGPLDPRFETETLGELLAEAQDDPSRRRLLTSGAYGFGNRAKQAWTITLSTNPDQVGREYFTVAGVAQEALGLTG